MKNILESQKIYIRKPVKNKEIRAIRRDGEEFPQC